MQAELPSPLAGLRVLELSRVLSGPYVGRMLADLGADVVKVEPPEGDITRHWGRAQGGLRGYFLQWNLGKRGLCIDLNAEGGPELVRDLASKADVLVENFRPHVLKKYGLHYAELCKRNPALVMVAISGFGADSPEAHRAAYAPVIHAESGLIRRQAELTNGSLTDIEISTADTNAALHALVSVLSALMLRQRTGKGQHIDMAMIDAQIATDDVTIYSIEDSLETRPKRSLVWQLKDGPVLISEDVRRMWRTLSREFGLIDDTPPEAGLEAKILNRRRLMSEALCGLPSREAFIELMKRLNMPWGDVRQQAHLNESPTLAHRKMITEIEDGEGQTRPVVRSPYRFSAAKSEIRGNAPRLGEHNKQVLNDWLELDSREIENHQLAGVLCTSSQ